MKLRLKGKGKEGEVEKDLTRRNNHHRRTTNLPADGIISGRAVTFRPI